MPVHRYLLDTNILSSLLKQPAGAVASRIRSVGEDTICTSIIVACELRYGAAKKGSPTLSGKVEQLLSSLEVLPLDEGTDESYAELRTALEKAGTPIGGNDCLIAAHALSSGLTLVTDNVGEFSRVSGLTVPFVNSVTISGSLVGWAQPIILTGVFRKRGPRPPYPAGHCP